MRSTGLLSGPAIGIRKVFWDISEGRDALGPSGWGGSWLLRAWRSGDASEKGLSTAETYVMPGFCPFRMEAPLVGLRMLDTARIPAADDAGVDVIRHLQYTPIFTFTAAPGCRQVA